MIRLRIVQDMGARSQELRKLLNQIFYGQDMRVCMHGQTWTPQMDVYETPEAFVLLAEIPGMAVKDLDIVVDRYHLKVSGCRKQPALSVSMVIHQAEIAYGSFERAFKLPGAIQPEKADATMDNGFLRVLLPKESPNAARIAVK